MTEIPSTPKEDWVEKIHGFLDPADDKPEHFAAIGRLITAFNGIEVILNWVLRALVGGNDKIARSVIGDMRGGDMLAAIKRAAKAFGMSERDFNCLDLVSQDIQALRDIRDHLAHRIWAVKGHEMAFTNFHHARFVESADVAIYTVDEINDCARYAPYLSEQILDLFPQTILRSGDYKLPSRDKPERLKSGSRSPTKIDIQRRRL